MLNAPFIDHNCLKFILVLFQFRQKTRKNSIHKLVSIFFLLISFFPLPLSLEIFLFWRKWMGNFFFLFLHKNRYSIRLYLCVECPLNTTAFIFHPIFHIFFLFSFFFLPLPFSRFRDKECIPFYSYIFGTIFTPLAPRLAWHSQIPATTFKLK